MITRRFICDGHEYCVRVSGGMYTLKNSYGTVVARMGFSTDGNYIHFDSDDHSDSYHVRALSDHYTVEEQFVRWYAGVTA